MTRLRRLAPALATIVLLALPATAPAQAAPSAAQRLIDAYTPVLMLRAQEDPPCDTSEEQYQPTTVATVLGNPAVNLVEAAPGKSERLVKRGPTAADIAGLGGDFYLNLPGDPLGETCEYAKDFRGMVREGKAPAVTYAHIAHEYGHSGLAVQYWFFWYFNQFNDLHEGDWEGMQIAFDASTPAAALREGPSQTIVFQHAGGERADWGDSKVQKEGTHPVVYPAAGSHATFYDSAIYVQNGQEGSGVGCDNTTAPLRRVDLRPVLLPTAAPNHGRLQWLSYTGHWGQKEKGFNNGPTGLTTKTQWLEPFAWMEEQRSTSPRLPGGSVVGPSVSKAFCGAVATVSDFINLEAKSRPAAIITIAALILLIIIIVGVTTWRPVDLEQLRRRRAFGQLVRAARQLYGRHWTALVPIGLTALPIVGGVGLLAGLVAGDRAVDSAHAGLHLAIADVLEQLGRPIASAVVAGVVIVFVRLLVENGSAGFRGSYRGMLSRFRRVVLGQLLATLGVIAMAITVVGIPFAVWKYVGWQFVQQEILFEDRSLRDAFRGSSGLVRGRWWHTVRVAGFLWAVSVVTGPVLGFALIFANLSLFWINAIGSLVFALLIPYVALGHTLLYFDLEARAATEPVKPRRRLWRRSRPIPAASPAEG
jgi:hypothetical protein